MQTGSRATAKGVIRCHPGTGDIIHPELARGHREDGDHEVPGAHWGEGAGIGGGQAAAGHHREAAKPEPHDENPTAGAAKSHTRRSSDISVVPRVPASTTRPQNQVRQALESSP